MKKFIAGYILFLTFLCLIFFGGNLYKINNPNDKMYTDSKTHVSYNARIQGKDFQVYDSKNNKWSNLFLTGVNIGLGNPAHFPGEYAVTKEEYARWFKQIGEMNANTIRVYTTQMPYFYEALDEYNKTAKNPIYLIQGVYLNEEDIAKYSDVYAENKKIQRDFIKDIKIQTDIIHGNANIRKSYGHAYGRYTTDVSQYVIGWILGVEWDPELVANTDKNNKNITSYNGQYVSTTKASPFEVFLASSSDALLKYETNKYDSQRPVALCNWVTTDPLTHKNEPNEKEDMASVDTEHIKAKGSFKAGFFASYHIYPYYPESLIYQPEYKKTGNPYKAYLKELNKHHSMPVLVAEVGIPSSRGITHANPISGYNQGNISEKSQGKILKNLITDIHDSGYMGALVFSWQDEWFKRTWNTMDLDDPQGRASWLDYQTCESNFGLLSFDPGQKEPAATIDGNTKEWDKEDLTTKSSYTNIYTKNDEGYIYLKVDKKKKNNDPIIIGIDTIKGQGNRTYKGKDLGCDADFVLIIDGKKNTKILVDTYYDPTYYMYAIKTGQLKTDKKREKKGSGEFVPITQVLNKELYLPQTKETLPFSTFDTGKLTYGINNPSSDNYNSLADFYIKDNTTEVRIPYLLLNITNPSKNLILDDFYKNDGFKMIKGDGITFSANGNTGHYSWKNWDTPTFHERLKPAYYTLQEYFATIKNTTSIPNSTLSILWNKWNQKEFVNIGSWFPVQPILNYLLALLSSIILYFFTVLLYIHGKSIIANKTENNIINLLLNHDKKAKKKIETAQGLIVVSKLLSNENIRNNYDITSFIKSDDYAKFLFTKLNGKNKDEQILAIKIIANLKLYMFKSNIKDILLNQNDTDVEYHGMITLSLLGAYEELTLLLKGGNFKSTLSYRSLLEILKAYTSDKEKLFKELLSSKDTYIVRVCIKEIGLENMSSLAPYLVNNLCVADTNILMDTTRSLGQLKYKLAGEKILPLLNHDKWELRGIAVNALASIDINKYYPYIENALHDKEWQVRYNCAKALSSLNNSDEIFIRIKKSNDKYATEILAYMIEMRKGGVQHD